MNVVRIFYAILNNVERRGHKHKRSSNDKVVFAVCKNPHAPRRQNILCCGHIRTHINNVNGFAIF